MHTFSESDYVILSNNNHTPLPITDFSLLTFLDEMDSETCNYYGILVIVVLIFITSVQLFQRFVFIRYGRKRINSKYIGISFGLKSFLQNFWNLFNLMFAQEGNIISMTIRGILWFLVLTFVIYYTFLLIMTSFMTTERLTIRSVQTIDTMDDLLRASCDGWYEPAVGSNYDIVEIMKKSSPTSDLGKLWNQKIKGNLDRYGINIDVDDRGKLLRSGMEFFRDLIRGKRVLIEREHLFKNNLYAMCGISHFEEYVKTLHVSKSIGTGVNVFIFNKNLRYNQLQRIEYALQTMHEFGQYKEWLKRVTIDIGPVAVPSFSSMRAVTCMDYKFDNDRKINSASIKSYIEFMKIWIYIFITAIICLIFEKMFFNSIIFLNEKSSWEKVNIKSMPQHN